MTKKPWNSGKSVGQKIKSWFCKHEFTESWEIEWPIWAKQVIPNAICHKCGKGQKFQIRLVSSDKWPVVDPFDIGEKVD